MTTDLRVAGPDGSDFSADAWTPTGVRGADKVAQRVLYALGTPQGTVPGRPDDGTPFLALIQSFQSEFDIYVAWATAEGALTTTVRAAETAGEPDGEKLGSVQLVGVDVLPGAVTLTMSVRALDGSAPAAATSLVLPT